MMLNNSGWLLANVDMKGFYRVNYDPDNWERLLDILTSRPQVQIHPNPNPNPRPIPIPHFASSVTLGYPPAEPCADHG